MVHSRVGKGATEERNAHLPDPGHRQHAVLSRSQMEEGTTRLSTKAVNTRAGHRTGVAAVRADAQ